MVDGQHVDAILTDDVEEAVWKAAKGRAAYTRLHLGISLWVALDAGEARVQ
jgi:1,2-phenylacetyl-CoA epoxidase PaaB subunit